MTYMLSAILSAAVVAQAGATSVSSPAPPSAPSSAAPAPRYDALREIGRVHAVTSFCKAEYEHATVAVQTAITDDQDVDKDAAWLDTVHLDTDLDKQKGAHTLLEEFKLLRARAKAGLGEAKAIKAAAADAPTPEQRQALIDFSDALAGALHRQMELADMEGRFVAYLDAHAPVDFIQRQQDEIDASIRGAEFGQASRQYGYNHSADPRDLVPPTLSEEAQHTSVDLQKRHEVVYDDENRAAQKIEPSFKACE